MDTLLFTGQEDDSANHWSVESVQWTESDLSRADAVGTRWHRVASVMLTWETTICCLPFKLKTVGPEQHGRVYWGVRVRWIIYLFLFVTLFGALRTVSFISSDLLRHKRSPCLMTFIVFAFLWDYVRGCTSCMVTAPGQEPLPSHINTVSQKQSLFFFAQQKINTDQHYHDEACRSTALCGTVGNLAPGGALNA